MAGLIVFEPEVHIVTVDRVGHKGTDTFRGRYDVIDPRLGKLHYRRPVKPSLKLRRGRLTKALSTEEIRQIGISKEGRRHAGFPELLLLGASVQAFAEEGHTLAFGSLTEMGGRQCVAAISRICDERQLNIISPRKDGRWGSGIHLLTIES